MRRVIACCLLLSSTVLAQELNVHELTLDNGMRILAVERHESPRVFCAVVFGVGAVNERPGITGISHLLEHMMFKGTHTLGTKDDAADADFNARIEAIWNDIRGARAEVALLERKGQAVPEELSGRLASLMASSEKLAKDQKQTIVKDDLWARYMQNGGTSLNASTGEDSTQYFLELPANKVELFFWQEADRMHNAVWREFYSEREVVKEERRLSVESTPTGTIDEAFESMFWMAMPYHWPVIGWMSDIDAITPADLEEHYRTFYAPNNAVGVFVGDVDPKRIEELARQYFGRIPRGSKNPPPVVTKEPEQIAERRMVAEAEAAPQIEIDWHTAASGHADTAALSVLGGVLNGNTGRLYRRLVLEKKLALDTSARPDHRRWAGSFGVTVKPREDADLSAVEKEALSVIDGIQQAPPDEKELQKAKNQILARYIQMMKSNRGLAFIVGRAEIAGSWKDVATEIDRVQKTTAEQVAAAAKKYLTAQGRNVLWIERKAASGDIDPQTAAVERSLDRVKAALAHVKDPAQRAQVLEQARQMLDRVRNPELRKKAEETLNALEKGE